MLFGCALNKYNTKSIKLWVKKSRFGDISIFAKVKVFLMVFRFAVGEGKLRSSTVEESGCSFPFICS